MNNTLSARIKTKYLPILISLYGFKCFYCKIDLCGVEWVYEHLNDDRTNNQIENIVLACQSCNNKKPTSENMKFLAIKKFNENKKHNLTYGGRERRWERPHSVRRWRQVIKFLKPPANTFLRGCRQMAQSHSMIQLIQLPWFAEKLLDEVVKMQYVAM